MVPLETSASTSSHAIISSPTLITLFLSPPLGSDATLRMPFLALSMLSVLSDQGRLSWAAGSRCRFRWFMYASTAHLDLHTIHRPSRNTDPREWQLLPNFPLDHAPRCVPCEHNRTFLRSRAQEL